MLVAHIFKVRYVMDNDRHTVSYYDRCRKFEENFNRMNDTTLECNYQAVVAADQSHAVRLIGMDIGQRLKSHAIDPNDFRFRIKTSQVKESSFWIHMDSVQEEFEIPC